MSVALHTLPIQQLEYENSPTVAAGIGDMETDAPQTGDEMMVDGDANIDDEVQMLSGDEDIHIDDGGDEGQASYAEDLDLDIDDGTTDGQRLINNDTSHVVDVDLEGDDMHNVPELHTADADKDSVGSQDEHDFRLEEDGANATSVIASQEQSGSHQKNDVQVRPASNPQDDTEIYTEAVNREDDVAGRRHSNSIDISTEGTHGPKNVHVETEQNDGHSHDQGAHAEINDIKACKDEDTGEVVIKTKQETPEGEENVQSHVVRPGEDLDTEHIIHSRSGEVHSSSVHIHVDSGDQKANKHTVKSESPLTAKGNDGDEDAQREHLHGSGSETGHDTHEYDEGDDGDDDEQFDDDADYGDENEGSDVSNDDDDKSFDDPDDVPATILHFKKSNFVLFTQTDGREPLFSDALRLFAEPLENFITAVKSEFVGHEVQDEETVLTFASLQLTITEDNFYARQVALQDIYRLYVAAVEDGSIEAKEFSVEMSLQPRFISRFNELAMKIKEAEQNGNLHSHGKDSVSYADAHTQDAAEKHEDDPILADEGNETIYEDAVEQPQDDFAAFDNADETEEETVPTSKQHEGEQVQDGAQEEVRKEVAAAAGDILPVDLTEGDDYDYLAEANDEVDEPGEEAVGTVVDHDNDDDAPVLFANGKKRSNGAIDDPLEAELETYDSPAPEHQTKRIKSE